MPNTVEFGKHERSNRDGFPAYVADRLQAVKWRNWKMHLVWQENMYDTPQRLPLPKIINLLTDLKEENDVLIRMVGSTVAFNQLW